MLRTATLSPDGLYRYTLGRRWATGATLGVVMLNPSTADALVDDPTIRRCIGIAGRAGYGALTVVNLFAFRATHPVALWRAAVDRVGPENDESIRSAVACSESLLLAWGAHPLGPRGSIVGDRVATVERLLDTGGARRLCLGVTMRGHPRHPLYIRSTQTPIAYRQTVDGRENRRTPSAPTGWAAATRANSSSELVVSRTSPLSASSPLRSSLQIWSAQTSPPQTRP